ncbi:MAG: FeoA family protein [Cyclobacteriaceae bacterium]
MEQNLTQFKLKSDLIITSINQNSLAPKLTDMGLCPGKKVRVLFKAPFGDPIAIDVEGYLLSLRKEEAALVNAIPST